MTEGKAKGEPNVNCVGDAYTLTNWGIKDTILCCSGLSEQTLVEPRVKRFGNAYTFTSGD